MGSFGIWAGAAGIVIAVILLALVGYRHIARKNSRRNAAVDCDPATTTKNRLINDQYDATGRRFVYGVHRARRNACEVIAVHNAKVVKGLSSTLSETMADFQAVGAMIGYGFFGSNPRIIGRVLRRSGVTYSRVRKNELTRPGVYILSFWNDHAPWRGLHTVAVRYDGVRYITYNLTGHGAAAMVPPAAYAHRYICGYYLG